MKNYKLLTFLSEQLIIVQKKKEGSKRKRPYMYWMIRERKIIETMQFISELESINS